MKISATHESMINWQAAQESFLKDAASAIEKAVAEAKEKFAVLKVGERATVHIKLGSITVAKPTE
jgi:hypothetical protein